MGYIKGTTNREHEYNIITEMKSVDSTKANDYTKLEGYTRKPDGTHMVTMLQQNEDSGVLVEISYSTNISNKKSAIMHANDCAYYDGYYYVVTGGYPDKHGDSCIIKRYNSDLKLVADYTYTDPEGEIKDISCIAHISGNNF